jgi:adenylate cyclase
MKNLAIMMADLSGFTAMTEIHGAGTAAQMVNKYMDLLRDSLAGDTFHIETVGDQVVAISTRADDLALTALNLIQKTREQKYFLSVHAGLHFGEVLEVNTRYYGRSINLTSRIANAARTDEILCSQDFINALAEPGAFQFGDRAEHKFKNVLQPVTVIELKPALASTQFENHICPVCRMQLGPEEGLFSYRLGSRIYHFCSEECKETFEKYELHAN